MFGEVQLLIVCFFNQYSWRITFGRGYTSEMKKKVQYSMHLNYYWSENAFYGKKEGPEIVMTVDSSTDYLKCGQMLVYFCVYSISFFCKGIGHQGLSFGFDQILQIYNIKS